MPDLRVNGNLVLINPQSGATVAIGSQATGNGGFIYLLPTTIPQVGQSLFVSSVYNGNTATLQWGSIIGPPNQVFATPNGVPGASALRSLVIADIPIGLPYIPSGTVLPSNTPAIAHQFVTAYNSSTGAFTQTQPAYSDISGTPTLPQNFSEVTHLWINAYNSSTGAFSGLQPSFSDLLGTISTSQIAASTVTVSQISATGTASSTTFLRGDGSWQTISTTPSFSSITTGTNTTAALTVGTGASLTFSGTGTVNANQVYGVTVSNVAPTTGQVLTATSATAANWQTPSGGSGTISLTDSTGLFTVSGSPASLGSGFTLTAFASQSQNFALIGPASGGPGAASFRALVTADMPASVVEWAAGAFAPGVGTSNQILFRIRLAQAVTFPTSAAGSFGTSTVLATSSTVYTASKNGTPFATFTFTSASLEATVSIPSTTAFATSDVLEIFGPASADATLANVGITLAGTKS